MNQVTEAAAASTEMGWLMGVMTVVFFSTFVGWVWWAYRPANRHNMEEAGRLPLNDLEQP